MADDKSKVGKPDRSRINVDEEYELNDWAEVFGVSRDRLKEIVKRVGPMVEDVKAELHRHHQSQGLH